MSPYKTKTRVLKSSKRKMTQKMRNMRQKKIEINYDSDLTANNPVLRECSTPLKIIFDDNPQQALSNISDLNISELKIFYLECLLPEIVYPLYGKRLELTDIREPKHIQEAIKKKVERSVHDI